MTEATTVSLGAVSKRFGQTLAVNEVNLALMPGQCVALVGHNGAGKSTLIKLMLGLIRPTQGRVEVLGADVGSRRFGDLRVGIGFLPENVVFPPAMTGAEVLAFYARLKRQPVRLNMALLERVGLGEAVGRRTGTYSKGMRQRLGLAQALLGTPKLLLLDEPTSGLDPASRRGFYKIVSEVTRKGATVLLTSHALAEIEQHADRVIAMDHGRKVADGSISDLRRFAAASTRILIRFPSGVTFHPAMLADFPEHRVVSDGAVEIRCAETARVGVMRKLLALPLAITDVEILVPTLDDIYADVLSAKAAE